MDVFIFFLEEGLRHILDTNGLDHVLFVAVLCAGYTFKEWKKLLFLITAFTVGHSITLALATLHIITISTYWVELLIAITILLTGLSNLFFNSNLKAVMARMYYMRYVIALIFGWIHGMGFSNFLRSMLGQAENMFWPLMAFNVGIEIGQIFVVCVLFAIGFFLLRTARWIHRYPNAIARFIVRINDDFFWWWKIVWSTLAIVVSALFVMERI